LRVLGAAVVVLASDFAESLLELPHAPKRSAAATTTAPRACFGEN